MLARRHVAHWNIGSGLAWRSCVLLLSLTRNPANAWFMPLAILSRLQHELYLHLLIIAWQTITWLLGLVA